MSHHFRQPNHSLQPGFTLLELLVVVALLGIVAAIVLVSVIVSREQGENAAVISQVYEYEKALHLYFADTGSFPSSPYGGAGILCLGDTPAVHLDCLDGLANGVQIRSQPNSVAAENVRDAIRPYMPMQPHIIQAKGGRDFSSPAYSSCADFINPGEPDNSLDKQCSGSNFSLWFVLKGTGQDCGRADVADTDFEGVYTLCRLQQ